MTWYTYLAYFFGGAFLVNAIPHLTNGLSGRPFPSPFASPPGKGNSSPTVNVLWAAVNLIVGYLLILRVGEFHIRDIRDVLVFGAGGLVMAIMLSQTFGKRLSAQFSTPVVQS
jgi:hypothetical protein